MVNIAVFASGNGSNAVNLVKTFNSGSRIRVALCLTDKENAPVIEKMQELGVPVEYVARSVWKDEPQKVIDILRSHDIEIIALAGFLCFIDETIVKAYEGKILNIHPSLLPAYGGRGMHGANVHKAVIEAGEVKSGATVHIVTNEIDAGPIVVQRCVTVLPEDTPETLEAKVHEVEYDIFPEAIMKVIATTAEPPALPKSVDDDWAETLGVPNDLPHLDTTPHEMPSPSPAAGQPAAFMPGVAVPASEAGSQEPMPPTYLVWAVVTMVLCCFIPGIVAVVNASKVSSRYFAGDYEGARRASRNAEIWIIITFVIGVIINTLYLPLSIAGMF